MQTGPAGWREGNDSVFTLGARLPEQVFSRPAVRYRFTEFDMVFSDECWYSLRRLAEASGDAVVRGAVLEPPEAYYRGVGVLTRREVSMKSPTEYLEWLHDIPQEFSADALVYTAEVVVFQPPSAAWGVWAQRNMEVAVLAIFDESVEQTGDPEPLAWFSVSEALHHIIALRYENQEVPPSLAAKMVENYG